ncbi:CCA tRNA nucleotidyltransferase [Caldanaerobacter sp.]|uniref:CCA tRNA nucleotidyltransferase n=1 Tax=Caldanaerobacter sp. TaxID=2930036 RepID=UPI003C79470D
MRIKINGEDLIDHLKQVSWQKGVKSYVVGGVVRDFLLGVENWDIDVVVEGNGIDFAYALNQYIKGEILTHEPFKTATIRKGNISIDVISARKEYYDYPAALPRIEFADIYEDMKRRDFTINTLAYDVLQERILDFFGGIEDLRKGIIRILHEKSFVDDPTRIFRAIRYSVRYSFKIEPVTQALMEDAIRYIAFLSEDRIRNEIFLMLKEGKVKLMIEELIRCGISKLLFGTIPLNTDKIDIYYTDVDIVLLRLLIMFYKVEEEDVNLVINKLRLSKEYARSLKYLIFLKNEIKFKRQIRKLREAIEHIKKEVVRVLEVMEGEGAKRVLESRPYIRGKEIKELGVPPGPLYGELLDEVFKAKLEGKLKSKEEEVMFIKDILDKRKERKSCC